MTVKVTKTLTCDRCRSEIDESDDAVIIKYRMGIYGDNSDLSCGQDLHFCNKCSIQYTEWFKPGSTGMRRIP